LALFAFISISAAFPGADGTVSRAAADDVPGDPFADLDASGAPANTASKPEEEPWWSRNTLFRRERH
jgi:hypothetical protein